MLACSRSGAVWTKRWQAPTTASATAPLKGPTTTTKAKAKAKAGTKARTKAGTKAGTKASATAAGQSTPNAATVVRAAGGRGTGRLVVRTAATATVVGVVRPLTGASFVVRRLIAVIIIVCANRGTAVAGVVVVVVAGGGAKGTGVGFIVGVLRVELRLQLGVRHREVDRRGSSVVAGGCVSRAGRGGVGRGVSLEVVHVQLRGE